MFGLVRQENTLEHAVGGATVVHLLRLVSHGLLSRFLLAALNPFHEVIGLDFCDVHPTREGGEGHGKVCH